MGSSSPLHALGTPLVPLPLKHTIRRTALLAFFREKILQPASELSPLVPVCTTHANFFPEALETLSCEVYLSQK